MSLRTHLSVKYLSDITTKAARDQRAIAKLERGSVRSFSRISAHARKTATSIANIGRTATGLGTLGAGAFLAEKSMSAAQEALNIKAAEGLSEAQYQNLTQKIIPNLSQRNGVYKGEALGLFRAIKGSGSSYDETVKSLEAAIMGAKISGTLETPTAMAELIRSARDAGAKSKNDYKLAVARSLIAGQSGSFTLDQQAPVFGRITAATRSYTGGVRGYSANEIMPALQVARDRFGSPDMMMTAFENVALLAGTDERFRKIASDGKGGRVDFTTFLERFAEKFKGREDQITQLKGVEKGALQFLFATSQDLNNKNSRIKSIRRDVAGTSFTSLDFAMEDVGGGLKEKLKQKMVNATVNSDWILSKITENNREQKLQAEQEQNRDDTRIRPVEFKVNVNNLPPGATVSTEITKQNSKAKVGTHDELPD